MEIVYASAIHFSFCNNFAKFWSVSTIFGRNVV